MSAIAVVIPCYNLGGMITEAVESVLTQTRPAAEIVVVDDGSTDPYTRHALARLPGPRTRLARTLNRGVAAARNHGVRLTASPYIVTLDGDDLLAPAYLEATADRLDAEQSLAFVSTGMEAFEGASWVWTPPACSLVTALAQGTCVHVASMFRRTMWEALGGFDESLVISADADFWLSALEQEFRGEVLDAPLLRYRIRSQSLHHGGVARGLYLRTREAILRKHRLHVERLGVVTLESKEAQLSDLRTWVSNLRGQRQQIESQLGSLEREIGTLRGALRAGGASPVDFGELSTIAASHAKTGAEPRRPLDRHYAAQFLEARAGDIRGRVAVVRGSADIEFGRQPGIVHCETVDMQSSVVGLWPEEIRLGGRFRKESFDCVVLLNALNLVYDVRPALEECVGLLKAGGVVLATLPCLGRARWTHRPAKEYWRFTERAVWEVFSACFPPHAISVWSFGSALGNAAFLNGMGTEMLDSAELQLVGPRQPLLLGVRAKVATNGRPREGETGCPGWR